MPRRPLRERVAALPEAMRESLTQAAQQGESITSMSERLNVEYGVAQRVLWESGTLPWQGAKSIITHRLRSLRAATRRPDRDRLIDDIAEQVAYLYYAAREQQGQLEYVRNTVRTGQ